MFKFIKQAVDFVVYKLLALSQASYFAKSLDFFIYYTFKVFILILIIGYFTGIIKTLITPGKIKKALTGKTIGFGNILAAMLGVIVPVESFSMVPIFIGLLEAGIPLGIAFSFLITGPMTSEIAFAVFWGLLGPKYAFLYYFCGIISGIVVGIIIELLRMENYIEPFVYEEAAALNNNNHIITSLKERLLYAAKSALDFFKNIWIYIMLGVGLASIISEFVPQSLIIKYAGINNPYAVPLLAIMVLFFYINIAAALPVILIFVKQALPIGTILAFTMSITATSIPELIILKRALKMPLFIIYLVLLYSSIVFTGLILNKIFANVSLGALVPLKYY